MQPSNGAPWSSDPAKSNEQQRILQQRLLQLRKEQQYLMRQMWLSATCQEDGWDSGQAGVQGHYDDDDLCYGYREAEEDPEFEGPEHATLYPEDAAVKVAAMASRRISGSYNPVALSLMGDDDDESHDAEDGSLGPGKGPAGTWVPEGSSTSDNYRTCSSLREEASPEQPDYYDLLRIYNNEDDHDHDLKNGSMNNLAWKRYRKGPQPISMATQVCDENGRMGTEDVQGRRRDLQDPHDDVPVHLPRLSQNYSLNPWSLPKSIEEEDEEDLSVNLSVSQWSRRFEVTGRGLNLKGHLFTVHDSFLEVAKKKPLGCRTIEWVLTTILFR